MSDLASMPKFQLDANFEDRLTRHEREQAETLNERIECARQHKTAQQCEAARPQP